eukprot:12937155-Prorocentrum_lima.AAC.1
MKSMNKGGYWAGTIGHIKRAKLEIADDMYEAIMSGPLVARTQKKYKLKVLLRAQKLAETFLALLKEGDG